MNCCCTILARCEPPRYLSSNKYHDELWVCASSVTANREYVLLSDSPDPGRNVNERANERTTKRRWWGVVVPWGIRRYVHYGGMRWVLRASRPDESDKKSSATMYGRNTQNHAACAGSNGCNERTQSQNSMYTTTVRRKSVCGPVALARGDRALRASQVAPVATTAAGTTKVDRGRCRCQCRRQLDGVPDVRRGAVVPDPGGIGLKTIREGLCDQQRKQYRR